MLRTRKGANIAVLEVDESIAGAVGRAVASVQ